MIDKFKKINRRENSYIKSISFDGGKLDGKRVELSSSMNTLIGVRGSGKSSIIEAIRYGLDLPFGNNSVDIDYKNNLVKELLGSGGKITIKAVDKDDREFFIQRVYGSSVEIKKDDEIKNLDIFSLLNKPLYFGQKDLSSYKDGYENDLINKFTGDKTEEINSKIDIKKQEIKSLLENIKKYDNLEDKRDEIEKHIEELKLKIEDFRKYNVEEKLKKQIEFNRDDTNFSKIIKELQEFRDSVDDFMQTYEDGSFFENLKRYKSKENQDIFDELYKIIDINRGDFFNISSQLKEFLDSFKNINPLYISFKDRYKKFNNDFLQVQREINLPNNLRADDFIRYSRKLNLEQLKLKEIEKISNIKSS